MTAGLLVTTAPLASADQVRDAQWPIQQLDLQKAWSVTKGDGVIVAVIDSGLDPNHPDLVGQVLPGFDPGGKGREIVPTGDGHGTSMAAIIAAKGHGNGEGMLGVAPGAKILPIFKNTADNLNGVPEGIRWAVDHGAKVINISQGGATPTSAPEQEAVDYALSKDVLIVAASGNSGVTPVESPARTPGVMAVGGTGKNGKIWAKSNYGPEVLVVAPGDEIVSAGDCSGGKYCMGGGTSSATAYVSGTAALLRAKFPNLTAGQIANRLVKSAKAPAGVTVPDQRYGYGLIRPYEALTQDIPAGPAQGPLAAKASTGTGSRPGTAAPTAGAGTLGGTGTGDAAPEVKESEGFSFLGKGVAIGGAVLLGLLLVFVLVMVLLVKRRRTVATPQFTPQPSQPPYGPPQAQQPYPNQPYGQQPPPPGYPQYGNQPPQQPPYQNPYGSGGNQ
ncbi:type VII secretion-associated serine protease mycosin [Kitasatospora sp. NPDC001664]